MGFVTLFLLLIAPVAEIGHRVAAGSISQAIYSEAAEATGSQLCDQGLRERFKRDFDRRYGKRIDRLQRLYQSMHGDDPGYAIILTCRVVQNVHQETARARRALTKFERKLEALERHVRSGGEVEPADIH